MGSVAKRSIRFAVAILFIIGVGGFYWQGIVGSLTLYIFLFGATLASGGSFTSLLFLFTALDHPKDEADEEEADFGANIGAVVFFIVAVFGVGIMYQSHFVANGLVDIFSGDDALPILVWRAIKGFFHHCFFG